MKVKTYMDTLMKDKKFKELFDKMVDEEFGKEKNMKKYHVHIYLTTHKTEFNVKAKNSKDAKIKAFDLLKEKSGMKLCKPCQYIAIDFPIKNN